MEVSLERHGELPVWLDHFSVGYVLIFSLAYRRFPDRLSRAQVLTDHVSWRW